MKKRLTVLDLFCGAGGLSTGFLAEDFEVVMGIDNNEKAISTFSKNHPKSKAICGDMREINGKKILEETNLKEIDVVVGGPPCQGFSMAGKRQPNDPRNSLFREYLRIVKELKPKVFIMENVRGLMSMKDEKGKKVIDIILNEFSNIKGYNLKLNVVNTADYGVPQRRQRIFITGIKKNYSFDFPKKTHSKNKDNGLRKWVGIKEVLIKKEKVPEKYFYSKKLINGFKRREKINEKKRVGFGWQFNKLDQPSYTISARYWKDGAESLIKYDEQCIRMLTPEECALVQSFPKGYKFEGGEKDVYTQIGNAVPPKMAQALAKSIKSALSP